MKSPVHFKQQQAEVKSFMKPLHHYNDDLFSLKHIVQAGWPSQIHKSAKYKPIESSVKT